MDQLKDNITKLFYKFLFPSIGGALVVAIYSFVDTIAVGQGVGPNGTAAIAVCTPMMALIGFLSALFGTGGSVLFSKARGEGNKEKSNAYFTVSLLLLGIITLVLWIGLWIFQEPVFRFLGADDTILPYTLDYAKWILILFPTFVFSFYISCFVRNDGAPNLVVAASIAGGLFNVVGDWLFVFPLDMGMEGAGLATGLGSLLQALVLLGYLFTKKCGLRIAKPFRWAPAVRNILSCGMGASITEIALTISGIVLNIQIMRYAGANALAVFGVILTLQSLFQHIFSGVGQAAQPLVSSNLGAGQYDRISTVYRLSTRIIWIVGLIFTLGCLLFPTQIIQVFMQTTPEILAITPSILRVYALSFLTMGISTFLILYLQAILRTRMSIILSLLRSVGINILLVFVLPLVLKSAGIWWAVVIAELIVAVISMIYVRKVHQGAVK